MFKSEIYDVHSQLSFSLLSVIELQWDKLVHNYHIITTLQWDKLVHKLK